MAIRVYENSWFRKINGWGNWIVRKSDLRYWGRYWNGPSNWQQLEPYNYFSGDRFFRLFIVWNDRLEVGFNWISNGRLWNFDNDLDKWDWKWDVKFRFWHYGGHGGFWGNYNPTN
jgi:hypothetical protein